MAGHVPIGAGHLDQDTSSGPLKLRLGAGLHTGFDHNRSSDVRLAIGGAIHF
jgi:hypothetical protein